MDCAHHTERRPIAAGRQRTGVADRADPHVGPKQRCAVFANRLTTPDLVLVEGTCRCGNRNPCLHRVAPDTRCRLECMTDPDREIDGGRARRRDDRGVSGDRSTKCLWLGRRQLGRQGNAHCPSDTQCRCATDRKHADRVDEVGDGRAPALDSRLRQQRLIEHHNRSGLEPDDVDGRQRHARRPTCPRSS